jgi:hypothetical protein
MKTMIDSGSNSSLDEILEFLKLNNIKANKKTLQVADEFIKQNGGYQKFNETFKEKTRASASIQPTRPAPTIPAKPCIAQVQAQPSTQTSDSSLSDTKNSTSSIPPPPPFFDNIINKASIPNKEPRTDVEPKPKNQVPDGKSLLLDSIKNFKGGLKPRVEPQTQEISGEADIVDQLQQALFKMREFISKQQN